MKKNQIKLAQLLCTILGLLFLFSCTQSKKLVIFYPDNGKPLTELAAKEINKYIYQRTNCVMDIKPYTNWSQITGKAIILMNMDDLDQDSLPAGLNEKLGKLGAEGFGLITEKDRLYIAGGSAVATLYGAYRYAERIGVRFYLHGDVLPDQRYEGSLLQFDNEVNKPLFATRGILPFHDFPEGPDWWNEANYKAYFVQLSKMRMNFFALHTYPEGGPHAEPSIWIGQKEDILANNKVAYSYPSTFANTKRDNYWSYAPLSTNEFCMGAHQLFDRSAYGADVLTGIEEMPTNEDDMNTLFERTAGMFNASFSFGRNFGLKFCIGTETPLTIPERVQQQLKKRGFDPNSDRAIAAIYEGIFTRISKVHPLDYYWLWTPESWTWGNPTNTIVQQTTNDIRIATEVLKQTASPFQLALSGWVLGPPQDRSAFDKIIPKSVPISCISRMWGQDRIEKGFNKIKDRSKWAIPWIEEDPRMTIPQFWVGRMRADAADALKYGCDGLIGIHWRTRSVAPNFNALAEAAWDQKKWNPNFNQTFEDIPLETEDVRIEGKKLPDDGRNIKGTTDSPVFNSLTYGMKTYLIKLPKGKYKVKLQFCENVYDQVGKRLFGVNVEGEELVSGLDVFAKVGKNAAYEIQSKLMRIDDGILNIDFNIQTDHPIISGIVIEGITDDVNQIKAKPYKRAINAGSSLVYKDYEPDLPEGSGMELDIPRDLESLSFYKDYALHEFGKEIADSAAAIFVSVDGFYGKGGNDQVKIPRPANWISSTGPGAVMPNKNLWESEKIKYAFVDRFVDLGKQIKGSGNKDRFNYWANTFRYTKAMAKLGCTRGELDLIMEEIESIKDQELRKKMLVDKVIPIRIKLAREWEDMLSYLMQTVYTPGELGTLANVEQLSRTFNQFLTKYDSKLIEIGQTDLPKEVQLANQYSGPTRIIMLCEPSIINKGEKTFIKAIVLSKTKSNVPKFKYRTLAKGAFHEIEMKLVAGSTFGVELPTIPDQGIEYYISVKEGNKETVYPAAAPGINHTIIEL